MWVGREVEGFAYIPANLAVKGLIRYGQPAFQTIGLQGFHGLP
jgi:hypothetical protein